MIGKTLEEAKKELEDKDKIYRIIRIDGTRYCGTCDLNLDRINLEIDNGIVTTVSNG